MKTSILVRAGALVAAAATTFGLVHSIALYGMPAPDAAPQVAQAASPTTPR